MQQCDGPVSAVSVQRSSYSSHTVAHNFNLPSCSAPLCYTHSIPAHVHVSPCALSAVPSSARLSRKSSPSAFLIRCSAAAPQMSDAEDTPPKTSKSSCSYVYLSYEREDEDMIRIGLPSTFDQFWARVTRLCGFAVVSEADPLG